MANDTVELTAPDNLESAPLQSAEADEFSSSKLPPTQFRSLGGYLDYDGWEDRERFMELDRAIRALAPHQREVSRYCHISTLS
jgi:hypothetical protein